MKSRFISLLLLLLAYSSISAQKYAGDWHGIADLGMQKLRIIFHLTAEDGNWTAMMSSPDQHDGKTTADSVSIDSGTLFIKIESMDLIYRGRFIEENEKFEGAVTQRGSNYNVDLQREPLGSPYERPQTPQPPFPYQTEEVNFNNNNIKLAGTLSLPEKNKNIPVAIMVTGSGPQDRDETLVQHKPFLVIADHLARNGIATLRYDDRGVAESEGNFESATSEDFMEDAIAAVKYLKDNGFGTVGVIGHSEGGLIAAMVAASADVDFVISLAGTGVNGYEILHKQNLDVAVSEGANPESAMENRNTLMEMCDIVRNSNDIDKNQKLLEAYIDSAYNYAKPMMPDFENWKQSQIASLNTPWMHYFMNYNPCDAWSKVSCPVLALNGNKDMQVDSKVNLKAIEKCLIEAGNMDFTATTLKDHNHLFQQSETGRPSDYGEITQTISAPTLELITSWLKSRFVKK